MVLREGLEPPLLPELRSKRSASAISPTERYSMWTYYRALSVFVNPPPSITHYYLCRQVGVLLIPLALQVCLNLTVDGSFPFLHFFFRHGGGLFVHVPLDKQPHKKFPALQSCYRGEATCLRSFVNKC